MDDIDFDDIDDIDFNSFEKEDKKANFLNKRKPILKGTADEKTVKIQLKFTAKEKEDLLKYKATLAATTFNGIIYKLIELGKEQHKKELKKLLKKDK